MVSRLVQRLKPYYIKKALRYLRHYGLKDFAVRVRERLTPEDVPYHAWFQAQSPDGEELERQRRDHFDDPVLFSLVVPVWHTPELYLREMADSVLEQTYPHLELILANADPSDEKVSAILREYEKKDSRVKLADLPENGGIARNTNAAVSACSGDFICFLDHDDVLCPDALYEAACRLRAEKDGGRDIQLIYTDEDKMRLWKGQGKEGEKEYFQPHLKPDFNLDLLRSNNYICHFLMVRRKLFLDAGGIDPSFEGAQDHEFLLRCVDCIFKGDLRMKGFGEAGPGQEGEKKEDKEERKVFPILHIPKVLYHWRVHESSTADNPDSKTYAYASGKRAVEEHLKRNQCPAEVLQSKDHGFYRTRYSLRSEPLVSILIPNREQKDVLKRCLDSIREKTGYRNYEVIVVENNSSSKEILDYYRQIRGKDRQEVIRRRGDFNFAAVNNYAAARAKGDYLVFMNNDIEIIREDWLEEMLSCAMRPEVGAVGAKLYFPDGKVQSAGIVLGIGGVAGSLFAGMKGSFSGYMHRASTLQDLSAVTAALMLVKREAFEEAGGFSEELSLAFNDVDLCLKMRKLGYLVVYDPFAEAIHHESLSRGDEYTDEKAARYRKEAAYMKEHWAEYYEKGDPYYNPGFSLARWDYTLKS